MACFWVGLGRHEGGWVSVHRPGASDVEQQLGMGLASWTSGRNFKGMNGSEWYD